MAPIAGHGGRARRRGHHQARAPGPSPTAATSPRSRSTPTPASCEVVDYNIVDDFGVVLNPMLVEGQVHGGIVQGIGQALLEGAVYDESGQLLTGSFMDYTMPRADNMPSFDFSTVEVPCKNNAMGVKGCGEAGSVGAPAAVINALVDALWAGTACAMSTCRRRRRRCGGWCRTRRGRRLRRRWRERGVLFGAAPAAPSAPRAPRHRCRASPAPERRRARAGARPAGCSRSRTRTGSPCGPSSSATARAFFLAEVDVEDRGFDSASAPAWRARPPTDATGPTGSIPASRTSSARSSAMMKLSSTSRTRIRAGATLRRRSAVPPNGGTAHRSSHARKARPAGLVCQERTSFGNDGAPDGEIAPRIGRARPSPAPALLLAGSLAQAALLRSC